MTNHSHALPTHSAWMPPCKVFLNFGSKPNSHSTHLRLNQRVLILGWVGSRSINLGWIESWLKTDFGEVQTDFGEVQTDYGELQTDSGELQDKEDSNYSRWLITFTHCQQLGCHNARCTRKSEPSQTLIKPIRWLNQRYSNLQLNQSLASTLDGMSWVSADHLDCGIWATDAGSDV